MITRRRFISITLMMLALFVLFQGPNVVREQFNNFRHNSWYEEPELHYSDIWKDAEHASEEIILVGDHPEEYSILSEWTNYSKRRLITCASMAEAANVCSSETKLVVVVKECWEDESLEQYAEFIMDQGVNILFTDLPLFSRIEHSPAKDILGIDEIPLQSIKVDGLRLFDGFFLGGERVFLAKTEEEKKRQDLDLTLTWFRTGAGVETFMMGVFKDDLYKGKKLDNEELPPVIWSCGHEHAKAYVIQGDYFKNRMIALGILSAIMADSRETELYPIVNSQQMQLLNYPTLADENEASMSEIYGRTLTQFERVIVYPGMVADTDGNGFKLTSYVMPQWEYSDSVKPKKDELAWYLSEFNEQKGEIGYSLECDSNISLSKKIDQDSIVLDREAEDYEISALYIPPEMNIESSLNKLPERLNRSVNTVCSQYLLDRPILEYLNENVTLQQSTATVNKFSYTNDLEMLGIMTALGYSNIVIDMKPILWPQDEEDQWQNASRRIFSLIDTYWTIFGSIGKNTASEGDRRVRNFLSVSYDYRQDGDTVYLNAEHFSGEVSFILRTHNQKVVGVSNGSYARIEQDVYLITVESGNTEINLETEINMKK